MKRRLIALLVASIFLIQMNDVSNAAVKAGSACTKLNSTSTSGGYKYTCIKSGKKLIWSKGVRVSSTKPTNTAEPKEIISFQDYILGNSMSLRKADYAIQHQDICNFRVGR